MSLYKIMLVDDEEEVRKSIIKNINWKEAGFIVVGDAENGADALEKIEAAEPDVVITDIRMPYMDGLELTERLQKKYPSIKVLIFSGYDDFEYAQKAIKLNVAEYILKPVNLKELTEILKKIKGFIDEDIEAKRNIELLRENYRQSLPILREQFLNNLINHELEENYVNSKFREYDIDLANAQKWVVVAVEIEGSENGTFSKETELIPISVKGLIEENIKSYCRFTMFTSMTYNRIIIIAAFDGKNTQTGFMDVLRSVCKDSKKILETTITMGMGSNCQSVKDIYKSYNSAIDALGYKNIVGIGEMVYINDVEPMNTGILKFESKNEADFLSALKFGSEDRINEVVNEILDTMDKAKVHTRQYQAYIVSVMNSIIQLLQQYEIKIEEISEGSKGYLDILSDLKKNQDFGQWLKKTCICINHALKLKRDTTTKKIVEEAKEYIGEHFVDPELSVEMICRHLHMSPAYFSTIFKKETGQTYIAYLTDIRLNKAVELLNTTDDKTYIIASEVGYQQQNYFSYVFKKKFGVSPTKFRLDER